MAQQVKNPPAVQETQVVDHKFMCQIQSEARQTKMLQFGAERGLLQGQGSPHKGKLKFTFSLLYTKDSISFLPFCTLLLLAL